MVSRNDHGSLSGMNSYSKQSNGHQTEPYDDHVHNNPWDFENPWSHGLCNCSDECDETCYGIWCYPCFTCQLAWRMNESCWTAWFVPAYLAILRTKMRTAFRIKGSFFHDFCAAECCPCCTALQMANELRFRRVMS